MVMGLSISYDALSDAWLRNTDDACIRQQATELNDTYQRNELAMLHVVRQQTMLDESAPLIDALGTFTDVVLIGTGGSTLCGQVYAPLAQTAKSRVHFLDNIDPDSVGRLLKQLDPKTTGFLTISKSGGTLEPLMALNVCLDWFIQHANASDVASHFFAISDDVDSVLRQVARQHGFSVTNHHKDIGGRFSLLSHVGVVPATLMGLDVGALYAGAADYLSDITQCNAVQGAAWHQAAMQATQQNYITMCYADGLRGYGEWQRQVWSESLGKDGKGTNPIYAKGTLDQHSQLQLFLDGPMDKYFSFIRVESHPDLPLNPALFSEADTAYPEGITLGDALNAAEQATRETISERNQATRCISLQKLDEAHLGALIAHHIMETLLVAVVLDISPYGQPAVEAGKVRMKAILGLE